MKLYDLIKEMLTLEPKLRDSDKALQWELLKRLGYVSIDNRLDYEAFVKAPSMETIRRCRQKIQELHPALRSCQPVQKHKDHKQAQKGTFVFREKTSVFTEKNTPGLNEIYVPQPPKQPSLFKPGYFDY